MYVYIGLVDIVIIASIVKDKSCGFSSAPKNYNVDVCLIEKISKDKKVKVSQKVEKLRKKNKAKKKIVRVVARGHKIKF